MLLSGWLAGKCGPLRSSARFDPESFCREDVQVACGARGALFLAITMGMAGDPIPGIECGRPPSPFAQLGGREFGVNVNR